MTSTTARKCVTFLRRRKRLLIATVGVRALIFVPMSPYSPRCYAPHEPTMVGSIRLAPRYQQAFLANLELYKVSHISVGSFVLLRFWTRLDDPGDWVTNASNAVSRFVDEDFSASLDGVPQPVRGLIEETRQTYGCLRLVCPLVRAVAIEGC